MVQLPEAYLAAEKQIYRLSQGMGVLAVGILVFMMLFTVADVFLRYFFNSPIFGSLEITEFLMVSVGFLGMAWAAITGMHVKVDLIAAKYPPRVQSSIDFINYFLVIIVCVLIGWQGTKESLATIHYGMESQILKLPYYPFYWILVFGYFLLALVVLVLMVKALREVMRYES